MRARLTDVPNQPSKDAPAKAAGAASADAQKPTLMVIDGHSFAFRAFFALPLENFVNAEGQHTNAIHGFISTLLALLRNEQPTHIAVAFDISRYSFRTREYPEYKGTRDETPKEFKGQVPLLEEALHAMGITTVSKEDYEADDILATLSVTGREAGMDVVLVSGDRDTFQLVNDDVTVLYPSARGVAELKRWTPEAVRERYGIEPHQYPEIAALVGETSDNLIGIDKVGEKTAVKWITQYGSLDALLEHADEIKGVVGNNLREQQERAVRNRRLNRLLTDVELPVTLDDLARRPIDEAAVRQVFQKLQFRTLLDRLLKQEGGDGAAAAPAAPEVQAPAVQKLVDEELDTWLERAKGLVAIVASTDADGALDGLGLATETGSVFVPYKAGTGDYDGLVRWLGSDAPKAAHDAKALIKVLAKAGIEAGPFEHDTKIAAWLKNPTGLAKSFELDWQVDQVLGVQLPQPDPNQLVPEVEPQSIATTAWFVGELARAQRPGLDEGTLGILDDIELPLTHVLARMELQGVTIDEPVLSRIHQSMREQADGHAQAAYAEIGHEVNLGSPKQLQTVLFDELDMPRTRATKTGYSTDAQSLADLQETNPHPFLGLLLQHRETTKLAQIVETLQKAVGPDARIHTRYDQTGSASGRISSNDPNLQNIPVRTEVSREIRSAFVHGEGFETLLTADYSQIEMRIMAHLSGDEGLIEAFHSGEDLHRFVGSRIFGVDPSEVTALQRVKVKAMSYGLAYGLSAFGLSKQLRISQAEAKALMLEYFQRFGGIRDYLRGVVQQAKEDGYTTTIFGRRRPFPDLASSNRVLRENAERAALNSPIQGSAADIIKRAMLAIDRRIIDEELGSRMLLQVHDELVFEVAPGERERLEAIVRDEMGGAAELSVPLEVQVGVGPNWDAAAH